MKLNKKGIESRKHSSEPLHTGFNQEGEQTHLLILIKQFNTMYASKIHGLRP